MDSATDDIRKNRAIGCPQYMMSMELSEPPTRRRQSIVIEADTLSMGYRFRNNFLIWSIFVYRWAPSSRS